MVKFLDLQRINNSYQPGLDEAVNTVVRSGSFIRGQMVSEFEKSYAAYIGTRYCVGVGNGYDAIRLIFRAWILSGRIREGEEVIVPANTYIASILPVVENRLIPVPVEPHPETFNLDPSHLKNQVTARTRAILVVHLYGRNAMDTTLQNFASEHGLLIAEDNAQATGCMFMRKHTGSLGDAAAHSFFPTKNLGALGDAGAVTTDDVQLAGLVRTLGNYGSAVKGVNDIAGVNSRLDELQAAVLLTKLPRLDEDNRRRNTIADHYRKSIFNNEVRLPGGASDGEHVRHLFVTRCERREELRNHMASKGIETMIHYPIPPHNQRALQGMLKASPLPLTDQLHREVLSIPLHQSLTDSEVEEVVAAVNSFK